MLFVVAAPVVVVFESVALCTAGCPGIFYVD